MRPTPPERIAEAKRLASKKYTQYQIAVMMGVTVGAVKGMLYPRNKEKRVSDKFCVNCVHFQPDALRPAFSLSEIDHPSSMHACMRLQEKKVSLVTGKPEYLRFAKVLSCNLERAESASCGLEGKFYLEKERTGK